jgi:hypothetical protein
VQTVFYLYQFRDAPNNSNETCTFMCLGRVVVLGSAKTALKFKYENIYNSMYGAGYKLEK